MEEVWVDIKGFENLYQISNLGRVKGLERKVRTGRHEGIFRTIKERIVPITVYPNGYACVKLHLPKQENSKLLHRLLAIAFIPNPTNKPDINHKNGLKLDNHLDNLEWCTKSENISHAIDMGLIKTGINSPTCKMAGANHPSCRKVKCTTLDIDFPSVKIASQNLGVNRIMIINVCKNKKSHIQGLSFRYL